MSHELRTPLNAIIGYSEMLLKEAEDSGGTAQRGAAVPYRPTHTGRRALDAEGTARNIRRTGEFVVNVVIAERMNLCN